MDRKVFNQARALVNGLLAERGSALDHGDLVLAQIKHLEATQAAHSFFAADSSFDPKIPPMKLSPEQQAAIDKAVAEGRCRLLTQNWIGLAQQLKREVLKR